MQHAFPGFAFLNTYTTEHSDLHIKVPELAATARASQLCFFSQNFAVVPSFGGRLSLFFMKILPLFLLLESDFSLQGVFAVPSFGAQVSASLHRVFSPVPSLGVQVPFVFPFPPVV